MLEEEKKKIKDNFYFAHSIVDEHTFLEVINQNNSGMCRSSFPDLTLSFNVEIHE